ncbi:MAG: glyoxalase [Fulvimonas sp.]|nr:glyoxalase [Fulvimonas sp.]
MNLATVEIKAFVPALDMQQSLAFYAALGFSIPWCSPELAYVHRGHTSFLLQQIADAAQAPTCRMHLLVENVDDWYAHALASAPVRACNPHLPPPAERPWGMRDFILTDPAGVVWRIGQNL